MEVFSNKRNSMKWQQSDDHSEKSIAKPTYIVQQKYEQPKVGTITHFGQLTPPNQIIANNVKGDETAKVIINSIWKKFGQNQMKQQCSIKRQIGLKCDLFAENHFDQKDTLGYHYQSQFKEKLIYARIFEGLKLKDWINLITYSPSTGNTNNAKNNLNIRKVKLLAGIFTDKGNKDHSKKIQNIEKSHLIRNNFSVLGQPYIQKNYQPEIISFSASYQSANLLYAFYTNRNEFQLIVHNDTNSRGTTQWFNFTVILPQKHTFSDIKFKITNLTKTQSTFTKGMAVVYKNQEDDIWRRLPTDSEYQSNKIPRQGRKGSTYNTLTFIYSTKLNKGKTGNVTFAYGYPYDLEDNYLFWNSLQKLLANRKKKKKMVTTMPELFLHKQLIGRSSSGIPIQTYKFFFHPKNKSLFNIKNNTNIKKSQKKSIIILARQHPGQTQSSFICEGMANFLAEDQYSEKLKSNFIYHIIPLINPDGVLVGNYRTNIKGHDLNRNWRNPSIEAQPEVIAIKKYLSRVDKESQICLILDMHGHSKALNSFFYGVETSSKFGESSKLFPYFCSKKINKISYLQSEFTFGENKKNTARAVLSQIFPKALVYTLQTSFYGYEDTNKKICQFSPDELRKLGSELIEAYLEYNQLQNNSVRDFKAQNQLRNSSFDAKIETKQSLKNQILQMESKNNQIIKGMHESDSQEQEFAEDQQNIKDQTKKYQLKPFRDGKKLRIFTSENMRNRISHRIQNRSIKKQGSFVKAIQLIETTGEELRKSPLFVQNRESAPVSDSKNSLKRFFLPSQSKVTQRKKGKVLQQIPLFSISALRAQDIESKSVRKIHSISRLSYRSRCGQNIRFVNQKEVAFEEIRKKRVEGRDTSKNNFKFVDELKKLTSANLRRQRF